MGRSNCWNPRLTARSVGGIFFPLREELGLDARAQTPGVIRKIAWAVSETRSFERASIVLEQVGGLNVSGNTAQRIGQELGTELALLRDQSQTTDGLSLIPANVPTQAVVECDGGRIRARKPGRHGVQIEGSGWRETKNAALIRATHHPQASDPQPDVPACFLDAGHVADIAECAALERETPASPADADPPAEPAHTDWRPRRLVRTVVSSMACSKAFGFQMEREARRRRFFEASAQVFLGDGLPWNWTIQETHFPTFTPVLDFIHVISYLYLAARAVRESPETVWEQYESWLRLCWSGKVAVVLEQMQACQQELAAGSEDAAALEQLRESSGYLERNQSRMNYPAYRQRGFPVTTAWMESLVKEINYRVKGTEMFWDDPAGAEAILQLRAASLSDDERLNRYLTNRPGSPYVRKPKLTLQLLNS
jgi:hypothetical protein